MAPVALLGRLPQVVSWEQRSAEVTHRHPLGQAGAVLQAVAVAATSDVERPLDPEQFVNAIITCGGCFASQRWLPSLLDLLDHEQPGPALRALSHGVPALAGALAGARCGVARLPQHWVAWIGHGQRILRVADLLVAGASRIEAQPGLTGRTARWGRSV